MLIFVPLIVMFIGFLLNSAFHWTTQLYMQTVVNDAATYTAIAGGDFKVPYVPSGDFKTGTYDLSPTGYIAKQASSSVFVRNLTGVNCGMVSGISEVNGIARCVAQYNTLVFPTDPFTARAFGQTMTVVAEDVAQTAFNPNLY